MGVPVHGGGEGLAGLAGLSQGIVPGDSSRVKTKLEGATVPRHSATSQCHDTVPRHVHLMCQPRRVLPDGDDTLDVTRDKDGFLGVHCHSRYWLRHRHRGSGTGAEADNGQLALVRCDEGLGGCMVRNDGCLVEGSKLLRVYIGNVSGKL